MFTASLLIVSYSVIGIVINTISTVSQVVCYIDHTHILFLYYILQYIFL